MLVAILEDQPPWGYFLDLRQVEGVRRRELSPRLRNEGALGANACCAPGERNRDDVVALGYWAHHATDRQPFARLGR